MKTLRGSSSTGWELCKVAGCPGAKCPSFHECYLHLSNDDRAQYLQVLSRHEAPLELSGLTVDGKTLSAIIAVLPTSENNPSRQPQPVMPQMQCMETRFLDKINMQHYIWEGLANFRKAHFEDEVWIMGGSFEKFVDFSGAHLKSLDAANCIFHSVTVQAARLEGHINLTNCEIYGDCDLSETKTNSLFLHRIDVHGSLNLRNISIGDTTSGSFTLTSAKISGSLDCMESNFPKSSVFGSPYRDSEQTDIQGLSDFRGARFGRDGVGDCVFAHLELRSADFSDVEFNGRVTFSHVMMSGRCELDNISHRYADDQLDSSKGSQNPDRYNGLEFASVIFEERAELTNWKSDGRVQLRSISADRSVEVLDVDLEQLHASLLNCEHFIARGRFSSINLSRCQFSKGGQIRADGGKLNIEQCSSGAPFTVAPLGMTNDVIAVGALNGTDVNGFILSKLDLTEARLETAANLDKIVLQGPLIMMRPPSLRAQRAVLFGEAVYRAKLLRRPRWMRAKLPDASQIPSLLELQSAYRALRKAQEDRKDEPGSADFYYGEMEMRRLASSYFSVERAILTLYWLVSGYGLRAWRSFAVLTLVLAVTTLITLQSGLTQPINLQDALVFSAQNLVSITNSNIASKLNNVGAWMQIAQKAAGPVFIALAVLALRGRVKK